MPTEKSMLTVKDFYTACRQWKRMPPHTDIRNNSRGKPDTEGNRAGLKLWGWKIKEDEDDEGDIYKLITCKARDRGPEHTLEMIFYGEGDNAKAALDCSCEYFRYYCEVALWDSGSSRLDNPLEMRTWSNGEEPNITNPNKIPIICKHLYAALRAGAANRKPRGKSIEDQRKEAFKKEKEEKLAREKVKKNKEAKESKEMKKAREETKKTPTGPKKLEKPGIKKLPEIKTPPKPPPSKWSKTTPRSGQRGS